MSTEAPLTREEKRKNERLKAEVDQVYNSLTQQFLTLFTTSTDPEGKDIDNKAKQVCAQWRTYCKGKSLIPTLYPAMDNYINDLMKEYITSKESKNNSAQNIISTEVGVSESPEA